MELAPYAAAVALMMAPQFVVGRIVNALALPLMARYQDGAAAFNKRCRQALGGMWMYAAFSTAGLMVGAEALMRCV